jgi:uncharacterized protein DUF4396
LIKEWRQIRRAAGGAIIIHGVVLLWFVLTALSVIFVTVDIRSTPESSVMKWAFVLVTAYTGPFGAFFYALGCREPLPGLHERYVTARWRQVLGSTMHCVAGDGVGILAGAVIGSVLNLSAPAHITLEYILGFGFGWSIFQALFMRDMAGGSYSRALRQTFISEFLSMNTLMGGMVPVMLITMARIPGSESPRGSIFWFVMSLALFSGALVAYPMNWWLVAHHLKHGMTTVRGKGVAESMAMPMDAKVGESAMDHKAIENKMTMPNDPGASPSAGTIAIMAILSIAIFGAGIAISVIGTGHC